MHETRTVPFLTAIDKAVPADLDVHLVGDNYATHNTAEIETWLARHPRFHVHFTPTGSSWMNQVERWFGLLTGKLIRRGVHTSVPALENGIKDCMNAAMRAVLLVPLVIAGHWRRY